MKKIKDFYLFRFRKEPEKHTKYKENLEKNHLSRTEYKKEKEYDYYLCDYCDSEIKITNIWEEKTGNLIYLPQTLTGNYKILVCLCNKCINPVIKGFEKLKLEKKYE